MKNKYSLLKEKSFVLAKNIIEVYKFLTIERKEFTLSKQLLKAGTNPGAMIQEAQNAQSRADFIHKLKVAQKEIGETIYWLKLLKESDYLIDCDDLINNSNEIMKMLRSAILTAKENDKTINS